MLSRSVWSSQPPSGSTSLFPLYCVLPLMDSQPRSADRHALERRLARLKVQRANAVTALVSSPRVVELLSRAHARRHARTPATGRALSAAQSQTQHNLVSTYHSVAGATAYLVCDPDPKATDNGRRLGVRLDICVARQMRDPPYHILLARAAPDQCEDTLRVVHHTLPPFVPLQDLSRKHLPLQHEPSTPSGAAPRQSLGAFVRAVRYELVSFHLRAAAIDALREELGLPKLRLACDDMELGHDQAANLRTRAQTPDPPGRRALSPFVLIAESGSRGEELNQIAHIVFVDADASVRNLHLMWSDGALGRALLSKDGDVTNVSARRVDGTRAPDLERRALGRIEGLLQRIRQRQKASDDMVHMFETDSSAS